MELIEKISIDEFDGKKFKIRLVEPTNHKKAVITHYLQNLENGVAQHYKKETEKYLKEYIQIQEDNNVKLVAENALQQLLFEVNDVPFPTPNNYSLNL